MWWSNGIVNLYHADARSIPLPDESVHCVVTSPPYWGLRTYGLGEWVGGDGVCEHAIRGEGTPRQTISGSTKYQANKMSQHVGQCPKCGAVYTGNGIGMEPVVEEYIANVVEACREVRRVLRSDGTLWLNLGDTYWGGKGKSAYAWSASHPHRRTHQKDHHHAGQGYIGGRRPQDGKHPLIKPKDLIGIPWEVAKALRADGWWLRSAIVWHKLNPMRESVKDRPINAYEHVFLFSKAGAAPTFWVHREGWATRQRPKPDIRYVDVLTGEETRTRPKGYPNEKAACPECAGAGKVAEPIGQASMFEWELSVDCPACEASGEVLRWARENMWEGHDYYYDDYAIRDYTHGGNGATARNVWTFATQARPDAHFATFPEELPRRCILAGTSEHGVCAVCGAPYTRVLGSERGAGGATPTATQTLGWKPTCECAGEVTALLVLDCFMGSGTAVAVAQALGRRGAGVELSLEYLEIAKRRVGRVPLPMQGLL